MVTSGQSRSRETPPRPPFLVRWALKLLSTGEERAAILNELGELYEHRRARDGDGAADAWYRRQTTQYPFRLLADRVGGKWSRHPKNSSSAERRRHRLSEAAHRLFGDFRHSATSLIKTPGLSLTIVLTVGLGIGATTTLFSVIRAVLLEPLPYPDPGRLVRIYTDARSDRYPFSAADYLALEEQQTGFSRIAGYWNSSKTFSRGDLSERMRGKYVTWSYFTLLGINPLHGRIFNESDGVIGTEGRVVVSHSFWARRLGGDEAAIGQSVQLDAADYTVVGVLPHEVGPFEQDREFFIAGQVEPPPRKGPFFITVLGRLEPATETAVAASELRAINRRIFPIWQSSYQDGSASWGMMDLKEVVVGDVGATLIIVFGAVGFVLVLASVNAANLLLARFARRRRELAVRAALGASRGRLLRLLLSESALLMAGGALIGLALAFVGIELLKNMGAGYIPRTREIGLNESILWFLTMVTLGSGLLFGLIPALHGARSRFEQNLRSGGLSATAAEESGRLRGALVVAQFAMAAPLLIGAGLLIGSLARLERVDPGIDTQNVLSFGMFLPETNYPERSDVRAFWTEALERVRALPGVGSATAGNARPPSRFPMTNNFNLEDKPTPPSESQPSVPWIP